MTHRFEHCVQLRLLCKAVVLAIHRVPDEFCRYQKIHWRALPGSMQGTGGIEVDNKGEVRFQKTSEEACRVKIAVQFAVPGPLVPFASLLTPLGDSILTENMKSFAEYAKQKYGELETAQ
jgi:uncharacterized membrane protein